MPHFMIIYQKKVREKARECHNHKPQPFPDPKRKRKPTNPNKHKSNKRTKSTKISSLFPLEENGAFKVTIMKHIFQRHCRRMRNRRHIFINQLSSTEELQSKSYLEKLSRNQSYKENGGRG